ncbi:hypothetical protein [Actinomadura rugatobispora]|uniref:SH3 domain-containing protein n=1 Tax=Actinomadura rugatobispora TaxID=1994 RepID=A0ABW0ZTA3_9ACTN|nr:hypothetical protein GCM10010200_090510 [Actinomadura rugatobispora]
MRCPSCGSDTGTDLANCARCAAPVPGAPAAEAGAETVAFQDDPTLVETRFAEIPPAPQAPHAPYAPPPARAGGRVPPYAGWAVAGTFALALVAVLIVLWPSGRAKEGAGGAGSPGTPQAPQSSASPVTSIPVGSAKFYVDTFAAAEGYAQPSASGAAVGELRKGTHYVFCKKWGQKMDRGGGDAYNHWWLLTDLDVVYGGGSRGWVPALYLSRWGNDEAKDNQGQDIPVCSG